jgi:hypothetical protein
MVYYPPSPFGKTTDGRRYVQPPHRWPAKQTTGVRGVWLVPDEEVVWTWYTPPDGTRQVVGYTIIRKK